MEFYVDFKNQMIFSSLAEVEEHCLNGEDNYSFYEYINDKYSTMGQWLFSEEEKEKILHDYIQDNYGYKKF